MLTFNFSLGQITTPLLAGEFLKGKTHASFVFVSPMVPGAVLGPLTTILPCTSSQPQSILLLPAQAIFLKYSNNA